MSNTNPTENPGMSSSAQSSVPCENVFLFVPHYSNSKCHDIQNFQICLVIFYIQGYEYKSCFLFCGVHQFVQLSGCRPRIGHQYSFDLHPGDGLICWMYSPRKYSLCVYSDVILRKYRNNQFQILQKRFIMPQSTSRFDLFSEKKPSLIELREYQRELAKTALQGEHTIILAETNAGKTYVAFHIIESHLLKHPTGNYQ